jgi:hypothetical protein
VQIKCSKCGGVIAFTGDDQFVACSYCESSLYVHFEGNAIHYLLAPAVGIKIIPAYIERWLQEHDYTERPRVMKIRFAFFPFWFFQSAQRNHLMPASAAPHREIGEIAFTGGDLQFFRTEICHGAEVVSPTVYVSAARDRFAQAHPGEGEIERVNLLHYPLYFALYMYGGREYTIVVDGATGKIMTHERPPAESNDRTRRFAAVAAGAFAVFFLTDLFINSFFLTAAVDLTMGTLIYYLTRGLVEPSAQQSRRGGAAP